MAVLAVRTRQRLPPDGRPFRLVSTCRRPGIPTHRRRTGPPAGRDAGHRCARLDHRELRGRRPGAHPVRHPPGLAHGAQLAAPATWCWSPTRSTPWTFYGVGLARLLISDPLFFLLGNWYGDAAVSGWSAAPRPGARCCARSSGGSARPRTRIDLHRPQQLHLPVRRGGRHAAAGVLRRQHRRDDLPAVAGPRASARRSRARSTTSSAGSATTRIPLLVLSVAPGAAVDRPGGPAGRDRGVVARPPRRRARGDRGRRRDRRGRRDRCRGRGRPGTDEAPGSEAARRVGAPTASRASRGRRRGRGRTGALAALRRPRRTLTIARDHRP